MWSTKPNLNPNPSCSEDDKLITITFIFGTGFSPKHTERIQASRRQLISEKESLARRLLSEIKEDDIHEGLLASPELVNHLYNCMVHLPKELDTIDVSFEYPNDDQFLVISRWMGETVEKPLDNIREEQACPVCLEDLRIGSQVTYLPCKHVFHPFCIDKWAKWGNGKASSLCPLCRFPFAGYFNSLLFNIFYDGDNDEDDEDIAVSTNTSSAGLQSTVQNYARDQDDY